MQRKFALSDYERNISKNIGKLDSQKFKDTGRFNELLQPIGGLRQYSDE